MTSRHAACLIPLLLPLLAVGAAPDQPSAVVIPSDSPLVAIRVVFNAGSECDPKGKEGLAALTAAMLAEGGTKTLSYEQVLEKLYPMAAAVSGACRKEVTVFSGEVHRDNLDKYKSLLVEAITSPRFDPADFERLRNDALDYLSKSLRGGNDEELGKWTLQLSLYPDHPYGHVDLGTIDGLKSITLDDVKAFHKAHYAQDLMTIGVAGGFPKGFLDSLEADLSTLPKSGTPVPELPKPASPTGLDITIVEKPADSTAISLGFPIDVTRADDDFYALAVANSYLGEHRTFNGKLMQDLRGKRGLNYGDYSYIEDFIQDGGSTFPVPNNPRRQQAFSIWIRPVPSDKAVFALRGALWEVDRLIEHGISDEDFEATRAYLLNYSKLWVQSASRRLGYAMDGAFYGKRDIVTELGRRLPKLTADQVNSAVRKHLKPSGFRVAMVAGDAKALADLLQSGKPTPLTYDTQGTPEEILAEDKTIAAFPLEDVKVKIVPAEEMFQK
jgi:zinc protease